MPVDRTLDTSKFLDLVTGLWNSSSDPGYGSWSMNGSDLRGLYKPSKRGHSVDLYLDINKNDTVDSVDKKVGLAATSNTDLGGFGSWNWSSKARLGDYFGSDGRDAGQFAFTDKSFLLPGARWDAVMGSLDVSKYQDVISGSWSDSRSSGGYGSWTVNDTDIQGLYKPSRVGRSVDLYLDINKSGTIDPKDIKIGFAATADMDTGGSGTWNWSATAKIGDYFGANGDDAGRFAISQPNFIQLWNSKTQSMNSPVGQAATKTMNPGLVSNPNDQITGQWVIENQMTWSTSNGRVNYGLIKMANQNADIIASALSETSNQANVEGLLAKYHSHELYIDRNANRIADSGDILVARGYSTVEGITSGGGRGTFRQVGGVIKAFDDNNVVVGNLVIAQPGYF